MFKRMAILVFIIAKLSFAIDGDYYNEKLIGGYKAYFPKTDSKYIEGLMAENGKECELAMAYAKLGEFEASKYFFEEYKKNTPKDEKLISYYLVIGDMKNLKKLFENILNKSTKNQNIRKKIYFNQLIAENNLEMENYKINKLDELFYYNNDENKFKEFFNSQTWNKKEMREYVEKVNINDKKYCPSAEKVYEMFATKRDSLSRRYNKISNLSNREEYIQYFQYADKNNMKPEIKNDIEELYLLKYEKKEIQFNEKLEEIMNSYIQDANYQGMLNLLVLTKDSKLLDAFITTDEVTLYKSYIKTNELGLGIAFLEEYPNSKYREKAYTSIFKSLNKDEIDGFIETYDKGYKITKLYNLNILTDEEKMKVYSEEIKNGNLDYLNQYITLHNQLMLDDLEGSLKSLSYDAYLKYLMDNRRPVPVKEKKLLTDYLYKTNNLMELKKYKSYLSKKQIQRLSERDSFYKDYYNELYPLEEKNIDTNKFKYVFFSKSIDFDYTIINELKEKQELEPQEKYYLASYYTNVGMYDKSLKLTSDLMKNYKISKKIDELNKINLANIKKSPD